MQNKKNNSGFSIIFAILFVAVLIIIVIVLIEYLIPFWRNVKGSENSVSAYYQGLAWIEKALFDKKNLKIWENTSWNTSWKNHYSYEIKSNTTDFLPPKWEWDSDYDSDWNKIWIWNPIQLKLEKKDIDWSKVKFFFRVPDLTWAWSNNETLKDINGDKKIINWQLSWSWFTIFASTWSMIKTDDINWNDININSKNWILIWTSIEKTKIIDTNKPVIISFSDFYNWWSKTPDNYTNNINFTACKNTNCSLKFSIINDLIVEYNSKKQKIPYLEYKIFFDSWALQPWETVPTRFFRINSIWYTKSFRKDISIKIPQYTTNQALDFAVFQ